MSPVSSLDLLRLRIYQEQIIAEVRALLRLWQSVLLRLATGAGKSVIAAFMALSAAERGKRVIFTCHRAELIVQISRTFDQVGLSYGIIAAGYTPSPREFVQIASIDTLKRRLHKLPACDLLVIDEAHHVGAAGWAAVVDHYKAAGARIVGLSATPWRLSGQGLGKWFDAMAQGPSVGWLIENGYLSKYRIFTPPPPDMAGVHTKMGDFVRSEAEAVVDKPAIVGDVVEHYAKMARGKKAVAYCISRKHSEHVAAQFNAAGISAAHVDGDTDPAIRKSIIHAFADGKVDVITNVEILTEGTDLGALVGRDITIECVALLRPTQSLTLHLQMLGRALRPKPAPAIILDHAGNVMRMREIYGGGFPDDEFDWSLEDRAKRKKSAATADEPSIDVRQCSNCYHCHRPAPVCPACGFVYEIKGRPVEVVDGELQEIDPTLLRQQRMMEQAGARTLDELIEVGRKRGYKNPFFWAKHTLAARSAKRGASA